MSLHVLLSNINESKTKKAMNNVNYNFENYFKSVFHLIFK